MLEVIPAINCAFGDTECVRAKFTIAEEFAKWAHLDIADGRFTANKTWNDPDQFSVFKSQFSKIQFEVHLMVEDVEAEAMRWLDAGAKRIVAHCEACDFALAARLAEEAAKRGAEVMLSSSPETPAERYKEYFPILKAFQVLAVHPGLAGQNFLPLTLDKVKFLRGEMPDAKIEVDGGINLETARLSRAAGADIVASASCIFLSGNPGVVYDELRVI